jgi:hypothetical protein
MSAWKVTAHAESVASPMAGLAMRQPAKKDMNRTQCLLTSLGYGYILEM